MRSMPQRGFNRRIKLSSSRVVNVWELRRVVHKRIPRVVFDYLDGGAKAEITLRENCHAFESVMFRPRQAVAFAQIELHTQVLGTDLSLPFMPALVVCAVG
jgi:isopentenyl diphosphate isomerase/L-lactate dehydrogenase-like FMN-dependent dehydrogenase